MKYVIGIDLGTSSVKTLLVDQQGLVCLQTSKPYPLIQSQPGYSEQDPEQWVEKTKECLNELLKKFNGNPSDIEGVSFSGQMHGLVLLDQNKEVLRNAILWNDTRTNEQCKTIYDTLGQDRLLEITKNPALEGFTLPKLLWVKENESEIFNQIDVFMLPKDYLRYRMTGAIHSEYSDAAGTLLLDIVTKEWSSDICNKFELDVNICPPLVESHTLVGNLSNEFSEATDLQETKVFAGGADNACGAVGSGILSEGKTLCSIGTSGVILSYEADSNKEFQGKVHYFNHSEENAYYTMGVTLAAGYSLSWFKEALGNDCSYEELLAGLEEVPPGASGLLFTPYLVGERTPHADSQIRSSFIGLDASHKRIDMTRAVIEGITFSLNETVEIMRNSGKEIDTVISIGGGAKNDVWLQIQADVFNVRVIKLTNEEGPAMGAAIIAAFGCEWFTSLEECADVFIKYEQEFHPIQENVEKYKDLFTIYKKVYKQTREITEQLGHYRGDHLSE